MIDEALLETTVVASTIVNTLPEIVTPLASSLFERFNVSGLTRESVAAELDKMTKNNFSRVRS